MTRKIDFKLLNDPTKTQSEQLTAISDGMINENWGINWTHKLRVIQPLTFMRVMASLSN